MSFLAARRLATMSIIIQRTGNVPTNDGEVNLYVSPEIGKKSWFNSKAMAIFVNGMDNTPDDHRSSSCALSTLLACPVTGVYNKTDGLWGDLGQCITDKAHFDLAVSPARKMLTFNDWDAALSVGYFIKQKMNHQLTRVEFLRSLIASNPATVALYDLLQMPAYMHSSIPIFAHSQGNLITSNALTALALAKGSIAIEGRIVNSFGSPCRYWPARIVRNNNFFTFDPVGWLDYMPTLSASKVGFAVAHSFLTYMKHDPEFVINRHRWGGYGMTFSMDEAGLANTLVEIGANPDRLYAIFQRLEDAHNADSDDVVVYYLRQLRRTGREKVLSTMARAKPDLIRLLIKILDDGWTTSEEKSFMQLLQGMVP
jgi:hypothetical protein